MHVSVCLSFCLCVWVCMEMETWYHVCQNYSMNMYLRKVFMLLGMCICLCLSVCLSVCLFVCLIVRFPRIDLWCLPTDWAQTWSYVRFYPNDDPPKKTRPIRRSGFALRRSSSSLTSWYTLAYIGISFDGDAVMLVPFPSSHLLFPLKSLVKTALTSWLASVFG